MKRKTEEKKTSEKSIRIAIRLAVLAKQMEQGKLTIGSSCRPGED
jgi:hypothetical protein